MLTASENKCICNLPKSCAIFKYVHMYCIKFLLDETHSCCALLLKNEKSRLYFTSHAGNLDAFPIIYLGCLHSILSIDE